jgi:predicted ArsR family transcriptional regulator
MTIMLSEKEEALRDELADHLGIDASGVMRQGMLDLARREGVTVQVAPHSPPRAKPKGRRAL